MACRNDGLQGGMTQGWLTFGLQSVAAVNKESADTMQWLSSLNEVVSLDVSIEEYLSEGLDNC